MSDLFLFTLNRSIAAGWVVLAVILARFLLRKAPRGYTCCLWWIVGARLLSAGFPQAPFSLIPSTQTITPQSMFDREPVITSGVPIIDNAVNPVYTESFRANELASVNPLQVWTAVAANIWLLVMVGMWIYALVSWLRLRRRVSASLNLRENIYLCDAIDTPFILGVLRPRIYLPSTLSEEQQRHVIAHEQAHIRRLDYWYKPLAYLALTINWFNPLIWVAYILLCRDIELACDELVIKSTSTDEKKRYSTALLECSVHRHMIAACPLAFGEVGVKERVKAVLNYKKPAFWVVLIAVIVCIVFVFFFMTDPMDRVPEIRWGGALYILEGDTVDQLPDKIQSEKSLRSVLHDSTLHPTEDGQAIGLGWEYAGQPIYLVGNALYLEEPGGGKWLPFRMQTPNDLLSELLKDATSTQITVRSGDAVVSEELLGDRGVAMSLMLDTLRQIDYTPITESSGHVLSLGFTRSVDDSPAVVLYRDENAHWTLAIQDPEYGQTLWQFSCEPLEAEIAPYLIRASHAASIFGDQYDYITYKNYLNQAYTLTIGIPDGWTSEMVSKSQTDGLAIRFHPEDADGFIHVQYLNEGEEPFSGDYESEEITYSNGVSGWIFARPGRAWSHIEYRTTQGSLIAVNQNTLTWTEEQMETAQTILTTLTAYTEGKTILGAPNPLGIHLSVDNPTRNGLTLITTQDGTLWNTIYTGADFSIAKWNGTEWEFLEQREGTAWTMVAYGVPLNETTRTGINWQWIYGTLEPGSYRIYKHYSAERGFLTNRETAETSCYAEFTIE